MAPLVVPNAVLVRLIWAVGGTPYAVNVVGGRKTTANIIDQGVANTLGAAIKAAFTSSGMNSLVSNTITLANVGIRDISSANQPEWRDAGAAATGAATGALLPPQIAACTTLRTALAGRSYRGRIYHTGFVVTNNSATGTMGPGVQGTCDAWTSAIKTALAASGINMAVVSRKNSQPNDVSTVQTRDTIWDTIRKRSNPGI